MFALMGILQSPWFWAACVAVVTVLVVLFINHLSRTDKKKREEAVAEAQAEGETQALAECLVDEDAADRTDETAAPVAEAEPVPAETKTEEPEEPVNEAKAEEAAKAEPVSAEKSAAPVKKPAAKKPAAKKSEKPAQKADAAPVKKEPAKKAAEKPAVKKEPAKRAEEKKAEDTAAVVVENEADGSAEKPRYVVSYDPEERNWMVKKEGNERVTRRLWTKREAVEFARTLCENQETTVDIRKKYETNE